MILLRAREIIVEAVLRFGVIRICGIDAGVSAQRIIGSQPQCLGSKEGFRLLQTLLSQGSQRGGTEA